MKSQTPFILSMITLMILGSILFNSESESITRLFSVLPGKKVKEKTELMDFRINSFETTNYGDEGILESKLFARELSSFENNTRTEMIAPKITFFSKESPKSPWELSSNTAQSKTPHTKILFNDNVILKKLVIAEKDFPLEILTSEIIIDSEKKLAETEQSVEIVSGSNQTTGTGLLVNLEQNTLKLLKDINSQYQRKQEGPKSLTKVKSNSFFLDNGTRKATYTGQVIFTRGNITIKADSMEVIQNENGERHAFAYGNPSYFIQQSAVDNKAIHAQAKRFEYSSATQILKMFDQAKLEQNNAVVEGDYLYYDTRTENIGAESAPDSRVKMVLPVN